MDFKRLNALNESKRILFVRNLPFKCANTDLYDLFGKYGVIRQIRRGNSNKTRGMALVVFGESSEARRALEALNGFGYQGRYLVCLYYQSPNLEDSKPLTDK